MSPKAKVTVSLDAHLVQELDRAGRQVGKSRSRLEQDLKRGYLAMMQEDRETASGTLATQWEAVK
jgi:metal-responsive CopG/Arc/MetJ family transcriptional regulator